VHLNPDAEYAQKILNALEKKNGYCPCRLQQTPENICICREFREQIADPGFSGFCHCKLYYKD
jgi:ferredoxin-thioredoxin reductase catalytic subunit